MEFSNQFTVSAPLEKVWATLTTIEDVAPCVPGASITEMIDAQHFKGQVKIKLGAVQMVYRGQMAMSTDEAEHSISLEGKGAEARGNGGATGKVLVTLTAESGGTRVDIHTDVDVTGRVATFGRSIMQDVSNRLIQQFSACLQEKLSDAGGSGASGSEAKGSATAPPSSESDTASSPPVSPALQESAVRPPARQTSTVAGELRVMDIVADIARARTAQALRLLADMIEPR